MGGVAGSLYWISISFRLPWIHMYIFRWDLTPYAESFAPIIRKLQNVASVFAMLDRG